MLNGNRLDMVTFFSSQLYSATISTLGRIIIGGLITPSARLVTVDSTLEERVIGYERLKMDAFEQMKVCKVGVGQVRWIYSENHLIPLPNVECTTLQNQAILWFLPGDDEVVHPASPLPPTYSP